jgi:hypothetical protein
VFRIGRVPRNLWPIGERLEPRFGRLGREYKQVVFDKENLKKEPLAEWVTPGHPLFESIREEVLEIVRNDLARGAVFFDLNRDKPARLSVFAAAIRDGRGNELHKRLFIVQQNADGSMDLKQPTYLLDLMAAPPGTAVPDNVVLDDAVAERFVVGEALQPFLAEIVKERTREIETISRHMEISLNELINRQQLRMGDLYEQQGNADSNSPVAANIKQVEDRLDELNGRLERRRLDPERKSPGVAPFVRDDEIERIAVEAVIAHERARGWEVTSVEADNRGFDLISRRPHPEDPQTAIEVRFIEVKGRVAIGEVALTTNEYRTAQRLRKDYWLYVVFNCGTKPEVNVVQDPSTLNWQPLVKIEHYHVNPKAILDAAS